MTPRHIRYFAHQRSEPDTVIKHSISFRSLFNSASKVSACRIWLPLSTPSPQSAEAIIFLKKFEATFPKTLGEDT
jgi:hypothetical protein